MIGLIVWLQDSLMNCQKYLEKNSYFDEGTEEVDDFDFNQDFDMEEGARSPGWIRYQKRIK